MLSRRQFLYALGATTLAPVAVPAQSRHSAVIPRTGERIPAIGMGTWLTFDVADSRSGIAARTDVLRAFFDAGGSVIDSSPMYGSSQAALGKCLARLASPPALFAATKVWSPSQWLGRLQMENASALWGVPQFDLLQVHNLLAWKKHRETLLEWRAAGRVRYIGVTTSHGRRHADLRAIIEREPIDFVQLTYNIADRAAEDELLPAAAAAGIAVIANRPFRGSRLFDPVRERPLPRWAADIDCSNWAQFFLKFIISHPAITCAIPATTRVEHMQQNMGALYGRLPSTAQRRAMAVYYNSL